MQVVATLVDPVDGSPYIFSTSTSTGRSALAKVIFACKKLRKTAPDDYPVVKLGVGGFQHRDDRIGWVPTPSFEVVRCVKKDGTPLNEVPAAEDLDDEIPF
jgi:hypothetical protein